MSRDTVAFAHDHGWSKNYPSHHEIFDSYAPFPVHVKKGHIFDFLGTVAREEVTKGNGSAQQDMLVTPDLPRFDEGYFQWIDLLEAARHARGRFTYVELGAGYGIWSARAVFAAKMNGCAARSILVEAEPRHAHWARQTMADNGICAPEFVLHETAVGKSRGSLYFGVAAPEASLESAAQEWYGQFLFDPVPAEAVKPTDTVYFEHPVLKVDNGDGQIWDAIKIEVTPLEAIVGGEGCIDLIDMDLQGTEVDIVEANLPLLNARVKRMHIETHSDRIELRIRRALNGAGWRNLFDYPCTKAVETPFGRIVFGGGVQSWVNPRLVA